MNIQHFLEDALTKDLLKVTGADFPAIVKPAQRSEFGHYQANGIMAVSYTHLTLPTTPYV